MSAETLPPPCPLCAPNDAAWMDTPDGLRRCTCPRGRALAEADAAKRTAAQQKARKAADRDAEKKRQRIAEWRQRKASERKLAARYRDMPLMDDEPEC